jgi:hypothetical protein
MKKLFYLLVMLSPALCFSQAQILDPNTSHRCCTERIHTVDEDNLPTSIAVTQCVAVVGQGPEAGQEAYEEACARSQYLGRRALQILKQALSLSVTKD